MTIPTTRSFTAETTIGQVLSACPQALGVLVEHGFRELLSDPAAPAITGLTLAAAEQERGFPEGRLLASINRAYGFCQQLSGKQEVQPAVAITRQMVVADIVDAHPATLEVFLAHGFHALADEEMRRTVARNVTVEMGCMMHGLNADEFVAQLNAAAASA